MSSLLEIGDDGIYPDAEVQKLQNLVKTLETQNEVLRRTQHPGSNSNIEYQPEYASEVFKASVNNSVFYNTRKHPERKHSPIVNTYSLENVELVDNNTLIEGSDDSWLYVSPRLATPQQTRVSPYKWVRQEFDQPSPAVQTARKSLKYKLEEVTQTNGSSSPQSLQNDSTPCRGSIAAMGLSTSDDTSTTVNIPTPRIRKLHSFKPTMTLHSSPEGSEISSGIYQRPKKHKVKPSLIGTPSDKGNKNLEITAPYPNVTDIENLAKMQEESLRQSITQPSPKPDEMNRRNSNNSSSSDYSSPPESPFDNNQNLHPSNSGKGGLRSGIPCVSRHIPRALHHAQHHNSNLTHTDNYTEHRTAQNKETHQFTSRLQNQLIRPSASVNGSTKQSDRTMGGAAHNRTGLPTLKRSIPKPSTVSTPRSGEAQPKKISGLPAPKFNYSDYRTEDNWREGCF